MNNRPDLSAADIFNRYRNWDELRFSISPQQVPAWLNTSVVRVVYHHQLFDDPANQLPTFNSLAIESVLHRIKGLSNHFLYMNNDIFFGRESTVHDFISDNSYNRFLDWALDSSIHAPCFNLHPKFERPNDCDRIQFYRDRMLALRSWGVFIGYWFAHTPHLWERRVLFHVERRLHSEYQTMRSQNRVRNELNDVSVHTHYEAWLQHQWNMRAKSERRVDSVFVVNSNQPVDQSSSVSMLRRHNMYLYRTFADADLTNNDWYITLDCQLNERPLFIGIEDDLKHATPAAMQMHANKLSGLLQRHFPHQSPAELTPPSAQYLDSAPSCIKL